MSIRKLLGEKILFFDGGTGSFLQEKGLKAGELPENWNLSNKDVIIDMHKKYFEAGSDIVNTNTFGANALKFPDNLKEIVTAAILNVKTAEKIANKNKPGYVCLDIGSTGKLLEPMGDLSFDKCYDLYKEVIEIAVDCGIDAILIETMTDTYEAKAAVLAAKENSDVPVFITFTFDEAGKLLTGADVKTVVSIFEGLKVDAIGVNCGLGPIEMKPIIEELIKYSSIPIIVTPNAGLPENINGETVYNFSSENFKYEMENICKKGAWLLGGCCGTTPKYIEEMVEICENIKPKPLETKNHTIASSYAKSVVFAEKTVLIGERINPTGKPSLKKALIENNLDYILEEALAQQDLNADILDVNVGIPDIDEPSVMVDVVKNLQAIIDLPLQIDTSDAVAMENALRIYNGKAVINSVNGKQEVMDAVFPLVAKYGGVVVGLTLDETGIPKEASKRVDIAKKIYKEALKYNIQEKDIIIDPLAMTVSADNKSAIETLEALRIIKNELKGKTILGVSNISFGLPKREIITSTFFSMAMQNGLSAAIINPKSKEIMNAYYSYNALSGLDLNCENYINEATESIKTTDDNVELDIKSCIIKGLKDKTNITTKELLKTKLPLDIINEEIIPALDVVGKRFEEGTLFLPQLLMSADAAKAAFSVLKVEMEKNGIEVVKKEKIILATVKGDIHDIGKNIVKVLLENYGYDVVDLGKDVDYDVIYDTIKKDNIKLVGLSALMTTTVNNMKETIAGIKKLDVDCKVMVGGAVLNEEYAKVIGADSYCKDAMATVLYTKEFYGN